MDIAASRAAEIRKDDFMKRICSLLLALVMILGLIPSAFAANAPAQPLGIEEYPVLEYEVDMPLTFGDSDSIYVTFTPEETGSYNFCSKGDVDTYAYLYDSEMEYIDDSDDCYEASHGHEKGQNFCLTAELEAGQTYVLCAASWYSEEGPVSIRVGCGHSFVEEILTDGGCRGSSEVRYTCTFCGLTHVQNVYLGHDFDDGTTKDPTCTEDGVTTFTCRKCGLTEGYTIKAPGHDFDENLICTRCKQPPATSGTWEQLSWKVENGVLTITGEGEMPDGDGFLNVFTDWEYRPNSLFMYLPIQEIVVGEGITSISGGAFMGCTQVKKVTLPDTITSIGQSAFEDCGALTSITLPDSVEYIDRFAFRNCDLRRFHIPANAELEDDYDEDYSAPFIGNDKLSIFTVSSANPYYSADAQGAVYSKDKTELVMLPNGYTGSYTLPASVSTELPSFTKYAGLEAIHAAEGNPYHYSEDGVLFTTVLQWDMDEEIWVEAPSEMGKRLLCYPAAKKDASYTVPSDTECLAYYAFANNRFLKEVTVPAGCIGLNFDNEFYNCTALEAVHIEEGHEIFYSIDGMVFEPHIYETYDPNTGEANDAVEMGDYLVFCPIGKELGNYTLGSNVTGIGENAFNNCTGLTELTIPATCIDLEPASCLYNCSSLQAVWFAEDHPEFYSTEDGVVINKKDVFDPAHENTYAPGECLVYFPTGRTGHYAIPEGITYLGWDSMLDTRLSGITFPATFLCFGVESLDSDSLHWMLFTGDRPFCSCFHDSQEACQNTIANVYYPQWNESWNSPEFSFYADGLTYIPYAEGKEPVFTPFTDVPAGSWFEKPVHWALNSGITSGTSETTFAPGNQCLRAHVVTFLWNAEKTPEPAAASSSFSDVPAGAWYEKPVLWAVENGITSGVSPTKFGAGDVCSRYQVVFFLWKAAGSPEPKTTVNPFTDVNPGHFFYKAVLWAVENDITSGTSPTTFSPTQPCNRAQVVTFLYKAYN